MEGHGWVEREESDIGSRELNVLRSSGIQYGGGCHKRPPNPCHGLVLGACHADWDIQKVSIQTTHTCSVLGPEAFSDRLASPRFIGI